MILTWSIIQLPAANSPQREDDSLFFTGVSRTPTYPPERDKARLQKPTLMLGVNFVSLDWDGAAL